MRQANARFTYQDYLLLPEDKRYEILDGDLRMVPAPNTCHQIVSRNLETALVNHTRRTGAGEVLNAPCDVVLALESVVQPDLLFVRSERREIITRANIQGAPDLVVEILSESSRAPDTGVKRKLYSRHGVQEYWIVDPDAATVEVLVLSETGYVSTGMRGKADRLSSPLLPDLNLPLAEIFPE